MAETTGDLLSPRPESEIHAMPGEGSLVVLDAVSMSTGLGMVLLYFDPSTDPEELHKLEFSAFLALLNREFNLTRAPALSVASTSDVSTEDSIHIQDQGLNAAREFETWLDRKQINFMDEFNNSQAANAQLNGADDADDADDAELFGSDSGSNQAPDEDVESGDEEPRESGKDDVNDNKDPVHTREENVIDVSIGKHAIPKPSDGELYLLQFPSYLGIEPKAFTPSDWEPPTTEHHTAEAPSSTFSAFNTSNNTIRWRHAPNNPNEIQSNARVLRWSDGSLTLQVASNPREQFALTAKALAPPQLNPSKPTPTSIRGNQAVGKKPYDARLDSHTYLASPHEAVGMLRVTNHVTASLAVQSYADQDDDATLKLQETMAAATKGQHGGDGGIGIMHITEDPELAKKRAEIAEKEKMRAARRRQLQEEKERERSNRVLGRSGLRTGGGFGGGLTTGGLEDDEGGMGSRPKPRATNKPKARKPRRRNSEYSDEEDYMTRGRTKEDEYDEEDGFLVGSDEEPEVAGDASEEEISEMEKGERPSKKGSAKREAPAPAPAVAGSPKSRVKRRRFIEEEDDDE